MQQHARKINDLGAYLHYWPKPKKTIMAFVLRIHKIRSKSVNLLIWQKMKGVSAITVEWTSLWSAGHQSVKEDLICKNIQGHGNITEEIHQLSDAAIYYHHCQNQKKIRHYCNTVERTACLLCERASKAPICEISVWSALMHFYCPLLTVQTKIHQL